MSSGNGRNQLFWYVWSERSVHIIIDLLVQKDIISAKERTGRYSGVNEIRQRGSIIMSV